MTTNEMLKLRLEGRTLQEISELSGLSVQVVSKKIKKSAENIATGNRGKKFNIEQIIYKGIYDYFQNNYNETISGFCQKIFGKSYKIEVIRGFLYGTHDSRFTVEQIKRICEVVGDSFENVFKVRSGG